MTPAKLLPWGLPRLDAWRRRCRGWLMAALVLLLLPSPVSGATIQQNGRVQSGGTPIASAMVTLYSAGSQQSPPVLLGQAQTDTGGLFSISYTPPTSPATVLYLTADLNAPVPGSSRLATVLGVPPVPSDVVINERTTVATAFALAQFINGDQIAGTSPGLPNAAATARNLVDLTTGSVGSVLGTPPNGELTSAMRAFNSLADLLAACVVGTESSCDTLLGLARSFSTGIPATSLQAMANIARYPGQTVSALFALSASQGRYAPALQSAPDAWTLAIRYNGNGRELDGPGNMAIDQHGNVWVTNNYQFSPDPFTTVCGDDHVIKLTPTGTDAPGAPYQGGGLYGAGFGITLDPQGNAWVSNFGFQGSGCGITNPDNSVSKFSASGTPLSPAGTGFTQGAIKQPQGTASDQQGNIWIANCGSNSVTEYAGGDPNRAQNFSGLGLEKPFGLAIDAQGRVWIASTGNDSVVVLGRDGSPIAGSPITGGGLRAPMGITVDSLGNVWVANSRFINPPCPTVDITDLSGVVSITEITPDGRPASLSPFTGGGLSLPWGIAVDGNDNIWVANFAGQRLSEFCGAAAQCPAGTCTGMPISPATGYTSNGLVRNTGVAIDPSGNVWLANNWLTVPVQTNPGGHELVVFIGVATPLMTPLIGPPPPAPGRAAFGANCATASPSPVAQPISQPISRGTVTPVTAQGSEQPAVGLAYCYPATNAPPIGAPCTPFYPNGSPATGSAAALAFCQTYYSTVAQQQACIAATLGNVGGFINPFETGASLGTGPQTKPPPARPPGRYCTLPDGAKVWVLKDAPIPQGAAC